MPVDRRRYGRAHRATRAAYLAMYQPGVTPCALCGKPMTGCSTSPTTRAGCCTAGWHTDAAIVARARLRPIGGWCVMQAILSRGRGRGLGGEGCCLLDGAITKRADRPTWCTIQRSSRPCRADVSARVR